MIRLIDSVRISPRGDLYFEETACTQALRFQQLWLTEKTGMIEPHHNLALIFNEQKLIIIITVGYRMWTIVHVHEENKGSQN
jgi:hypothetical protein